VQVQRTGLVPYDDAWDIQRALHAAVVDGAEDTVLLLEHPPVFTAGKRTQAHERPADGTPVVDVDRGGKITFHGPGQLVGYPVVRLPAHVYVVDYVRRVEQALIATCTDLGLVSGRVTGRSGVWLPAEAGRPELIKFYVGLLCGAAVLIGGLAIGAGIPADPWLFLMLVGAVVALDALRIDVFERANLSPAAVPVLALAYFSGPLGPIAAEAMIALARMLRRDPVLKWSFDFGALSLAGAAAALAFALLPAEADAGALLVVGVIAGVVYYGVNSGLLAVVMGLSEGRSPLPVWRERLAWMVPHYVAFGLLSGTLVIAEHGLGLYAIALFGLPVLMLWIAEKQYLDRSRASVAELRKTNDELAGANARLQRLLEDNQQLLGRMHRSYLSTITSLARTVEAKDPYTSGHTERVAQVALLLASELGLDATQLRAVEVGAIIHDIGKIGIPDHILLKPGPLTAEETAEMRRHPEISSYILAELELPAVVKQMARSHHERFDGTGYPDELAGEEIPVAARILSVADVLDAMTSDRPYRKALPLAVARAEIERMAGTQFCPRVVAALSAAMDRETDFWKTFDSTSGAPELSKAWPA